MIYFQTYKLDKLDYKLFRKIQIDCTQMTTVSLTQEHYGLSCAFLQFDYASFPQSEVNFYSNSINSLEHIKTTTNL